VTAKLETLDGVLEPFRPGFDADGFDVSVQDFAGGQMPSSTLAIMSCGSRHSTQVSA
jgi:hypothetical protein